MNSDNTLIKTHFNHFNPVIVAVTALLVLSSNHDSHRMLKLRQEEAKRQGHMTSTDKQSPRPFHLPRRASIRSALFSCLLTTPRKPEWEVTSLPLKARMATAEGPARVHGKYRPCLLAVMKHC